MEESIRFAKKYLEDMLSFFGINIDVSATCEEEVIELRVPSTHLNGFLIGQHGDTLRSIQYMVSTALKHNEMELSRVSVDIADYKRHRQDQLAEKVEGWIEKVRKSKEKMNLRPMNAADRRVVHKVVGDSRGVESGSEGEGRDRYVVITPAATDVEEPDVPAEEDNTESDKE